MHWCLLTLAVTTTALGLLSLAFDPRRLRWSRLSLGGILRGCISSSFFLIAALLILIIVYMTQP